jgi:pimeloyl-ACP methyl ester carboxylesterase
MLHGYSDSSCSFERVLPLIDAGFFVIAVDQRGHGDSDRSAESYTFDDFADDALDLMDALGVRSAVMVGHSMGSFVAQRLAVQAPQRVIGLVLIGSALSVINPAVLELAAETERLEDPVDPAFVRAFQESTLHRAVPEAFLDRVINESQKLPARLWKDVMRGMLESKPRSEPIRCPTLVVWGDHDGIFNDADQQQLVESIPEANLLVMPGIGHDPHWESPEEVAQELMNFCNSWRLQRGSSAGA